MPTPESSLSVAVQAAADFLADRMADDVVVTVDSPQRASKQAEDDSKHTLNLFVYRIAPSGFHADFGSEDPTFVRAHLLITAFPAGQGDPPPDSDLRVLGQAVRVLQSFPVIPTVLPGAKPNGAPNEDFRTDQAALTEYQMQAVMQAPTMEELNHIWTTQGGELAYRLSVAYELALIPIEPLTHSTPAPPVTAAVLESVPGSGRGPFQMVFDGGRLFSRREVSAGTGQVQLAITGQKDARVAVRVQWRRAGGSVDMQPAQIFTLKTSDVDSADARFDLVLSGAAAGDVADVQTVVIGDDDAPIKGVPAGNAVMLDVGA